MRFHVDKIGNALAWAAIIALLAAAFVIAKLLGFLGLAVLGLIVAVICLRIEANEHNPFVWTRADFDATRKADRIYGQNSGATGQLTETEAEKHEFNSSARFFRWCGLALAAIGVVGFIWGQWW